MENFLSSNGRAFFRARPEEKKLELLDLLILIFYYLFSVLLILSFLGLFNKYFIGLVLALLVFFLFWFCPRYIRLDRGPFLFVLFIIFVFLGLLLFKGYFTGDALNYWLPWAREIVLQQKMPDLLLNIPYFVTTREPFLPLLFGAFFAFSGFKELLVFLVPLFFAGATAFLLYRWAKKKRLAKRWIIFAWLIFLVNPVSLKYGWDLLQESLILFFFTAFFYYLENWLACAGPAAAEAGRQPDKNKLHFFLMLACAVLALASKLSGLILLLPLFWIFIREKFLRKKWWWALLIFLPMIFWFLRNYLIYDNPVSTFLNELFKGRYYETIKISVELSRLQVPAVFSSLGARLGSVLSALFFSFPFIWSAFFGFLKEKKILYFFVVIIFVFLSGFFFQAEGSAARYLYSILGLLLIYGLVGLWQARSRLVLSLFFFLSLWGLLMTKISLAQNSFAAALESRLEPLISLSRVFHNYHFLVAIIVSLFFYFFLSQNKIRARYLILLCWSFYLLKTSTLQISWLNIWLPILFLILIILIWPVLKMFKKRSLRKLVVGCIIALIFLNSWGLVLAFSALPGQKMMFPKTEVYGILPEAGRQINELEGANKDFYVYVALATYLAWQYDFKVVSPDSITLYYITGSRRPIGDLTVLEVSELFKKSRIKYIIENAQRPFWQEFFDKIRGNPEIFELILEKDGSYLWKVY